MISYGYSVKESDDPYVEIVEAAVDGFSESMRPGAFLADMIPFRELPSLCSHTAADANYGYLSTCGGNSFDLTLRPFSLTSPANEQCDMCLAGFPERDGKSKPSDSRRC